jgi:hypothetical protein
MVPYLADFVTSKSLFCRPANGGTLRLPLRLARGRCVGRTLRT